MKNSLGRIYSLILFLIALLIFSLSGQNLFANPNPYVHQGFSGRDNYTPAPSSIFQAKESCEEQRAGIFTPINVQGMPYPDEVPISLFLKSKLPEMDQDCRKETLKYIKKLLSEKKWSKDGQLLDYCEYNYFGDPTMAFTCSQYISIIDNELSGKNPIADQIRQAMNRDVQEYQSTRQERKKPCGNSLVVIETQENAEEIAQLDPETMEMLKAIAEAETIGLKLQQNGAPEKAKEYLDLANLLRETLGMSPEIYEDI
ncbi:MAG: hypothetical protein ABIA04_01235 [Pseudomonadota bacterium]